MEQDIVTDEGVWLNSNITIHVYNLNYKHREIVNWKFSTLFEHKEWYCSVWILPWLNLVFLPPGIFIVIPKNKVCSLPSPLILLLKSNFLSFVSVVFNIIEKHYMLLFINLPKTGYAHYGVSYLGQKHCCKFQHSFIWSWTFFVAY